MGENGDLKMSVEIYGETYTMKVSDDRQRMMEIVEMVDSMMRQIGQNQLSYKHVAVLAALNIAEEYFKLKDDYQLLINILEEAH